MIDPLKEKDKLTAMLTELIPPLASDINLTATSVFQFKPAGIQVWNAGYQKYSDKLKRYREVRSILNTVKTYINSTVTH